MVLEGPFNSVTFKSRVTVTGIRMSTVPLGHPGEFLEVTTPDEPLKTDILELGLFRDPLVCGVILEYGIPYNPNFGMPFQGLRTRTRMFFRIR